MVSRKVVLPYGEGMHLTGILEQVKEGVTQDRPLALILHGTLAHKDQTFHPKLVARLHERGLDSFRFDFHGNAESPGTWRMVETDADMDDLLRVVDYLRRDLGYKICLIIAHSRGSAVAQRYLCKFDPTIPLFVNVSGRRRMERIWDRWPVWKPQIEEKGHYDWHYRAAGEKRVVKVTKEQIEEFAAYDNSFIETDFPQAVHILTCHGTKDETVPVEDAAIFHKAWSKRSPGTSTLRLIEGANHNYNKGHYDELVSAIMSWLDKVTLKTKLWSASRRIRLLLHYRDFYRYDAKPNGTTNSPTATFCPLLLLDRSAIELLGATLDTLAVALSLLVEMLIDPARLASASARTLVALP